MPGTRMSLPQFAQRHGVTTVSAYQWRDKGWIVVDEHNIVDVEASDAMLARHRDPNAPTIRNARKVRAAPAAPAAGLDPAAAAALQRIMAAQAPAAPSVPPPVFFEDAEAGDDETVEDAAARIVALQGARVSTNEARRIKENYLALKAKLDHEVAEGSLILLEVAQTILFEEARNVRNAWLNWPAKFGALIAAELDLPADKVTEVVTKYIHKQVESLGEPDPDFKRS